MANETQKKLHAALNGSFFQSDCALEDEFSGLRAPKAQPSDMSSDWENKYYYLLADLENTKKRLARTSAREIEGQRTEMLKDVLKVRWLTGWILP